MTSVRGVSTEATRALVLAGIVAVALYVVGDAVSAMLYDGYRYRDQAISELSAFGSPVRPLMVSIILIHSLLMTAFGVGVSLAANRKSLRWTGFCLVATGLIGFPTHTAFAMSSRWMEGGFNDTMHIFLTSVFVGVVSAALILSAVAYPGWFRLYSVATLAVIIGFGTASASAMGGIEEDSTPWAGAFERFNTYALFAWIVVLALTVLRRDAIPGVEPARVRTPDSGD
ncbi:DUF998 domain-containing protein [Rhodococcus sp. NPDC003318]|uniref:DUF998 domain-containing protein n=1 Tax=Rhodococcus sp. NPDC003318 TaxID=3364503 RepID=UPI00368A4E49